MTRPRDGRFLVYETNFLFVDYIDLVVYYHGMISTSLQSMSEELPLSVLTVFPGLESHLARRTVILGSLDA